MFLLMIEYHGKIAGVILRDDCLKYVLAEPEGENLHFNSYGEIDLNNGNEDFALLAGHRIICGIDHNRFSRKRFSVAAEVAGDPDHLLWELSKKHTDDIRDFYLTFLRLQSSNDVSRLESLAIRKKTFEKTGKLFDRHSLVLEKLIFEPEALRVFTRDLVSDERTAVLLVEQSMVLFQLYRGKHLAESHTLYPIDSATARGRKSLADELGMLFIAVFGGLPSSHKVDLLLIGDEPRTNLAVMVADTLPCDFQIRDISPSQFDDIVDHLPDELFHHYFLPISLTCLYNRSRLCASSREKNEVFP